MAVKGILVGLLAFSFLLSSCYPELSVQQYDKLRQDLAALDTERQQLSGQVASLDAEFKAFKAKNAKTLAYVDFLERLGATQVSEKILSGQFDAAALIKAKRELTRLANDLGDNDIISFLETMKPDNDSQTVQAYYKIVEYSLKKMKQNLGE